MKLRDLGLIVISAGLFACGRGSDINTSDMAHGALDAGRDSGFIHDMPDAGKDPCDAEEVTIECCEQLEARYQALEASQSKCQSAADCVVIWSSDSCDGFRHLGSLHAISKESEAEALKLRTLFSSPVCQSMELGRNESDVPPTEPVVSCNQGQCNAYQPESCFPMMPEDMGVGD